MAERGEIDVAHVARLARLNLTQAETALFQSQLSRVLEYAEQLKRADTTSVDTEAATTHDVLRPDEPRDWFTSSQALSNAPRQANDLFIVPKVLE
jgi:aspartyl-tRNA(Asn)/glutamyl-tRNA(Gln) amidotransferase subunit C